MNGIRINIKRVTLEELFRNNDTLLTLPFVVIEKVGIWGAKLCASKNIIYG
jgi:hypothetical protein